jgi:hypothetical protein
MDNDLPLFLCVPTRSQFKNKADFDEAYAAHVVKQKAANEIASKAWEANERDYQRRYRIRD